MTSTSAVRPARKPADVTRASARTLLAKPALAKKPAKPAAKKAPKKSGPASQPASGRYSKAQPHEIDAGVLKRKATPARRRAAGTETAAVDCDDSAVRVAIRRPTGGRRAAVDRAGNPPKASAVALVERVTRAVERELSQIEVIVGDYHVKAAQRTEAERRARTLASLARTLAELRKLRAEEHKVKPQDDDGPRDINEFRLVLFKKLDRLAAEAKALHPEPADGEGGRGHHLVVEAIRAPPPDTAG